MQELIKISNNVAIATRLLLAALPLEPADFIITAGLFSEKFLNPSNAKPFETSQSSLDVIVKGIF